AQLQLAVEERPQLAADLREIAHQKLGVMESRVEGLWRALSGQRDVSAAHRRVHDWAAQHRLTETLAARETTVDLLAGLTARSGVGPVGAVAVLLEDTRDLAAGLDVQAAFLPKQMRWQAEYLLLEVLSEPVWRRTPEVATAMAALDRLVHVAEGLPHLVDYE